MKKTRILFSVLFIVLFSGLGAQVSKKDSLQVNPLCDSVVNYAKTFLGTKYKYASCSPKSGFDCSGFTWFVFNHYGISIPRSAKEYKTLGKE
ncbi:MAG TPA: NlpC/P60 family protein, partial [Bacteroidia bacterium]|nr:NlpC/P60 family protein [Bacteroidia bacterium]